MQRDLQIKSRSSWQKKRLNLKPRKLKRVKDVNQLCLFPFDLTNINSQMEEDHVIKVKCC